MFDGLVYLTEAQRRTLAALVAAGGLHRWVTAAEVAALRGVSSSTVAEAYGRIQIRSQRFAGTLGNGYVLVQKNGKGARIATVEEWASHKWASRKS